MTAISHYRRTRNPGLVDDKAKPGPLAVPGCIRWYAADAITGLADGDLVSLWEDGAGLVDGTSSGASRPTYKTNIINGKPVVRFNGNHNINHGPVSVANGTYFVVWSRVSATNNDAVLLAASTAYSYLQYSGNWYVYAGIYLAIAMAAATFFLKSCIYNGTQYLRYTNGSAEAAQNGTGAMITTYIGGPGYNLRGDVAEVIFYDSALSDGNRQYVENYLNTKYALW